MVLVEPAGKALLEFLDEGGEIAEALAEGIEHELDLVLAPASRTRASSCRSEAMKAFE